MKKASVLEHLASVLIIFLVFFVPFSASVLASDLPVTDVSAEKEWTFLVFVNGDNNLDEHGVDDHQEMASAGSNEFLNIVTLFDRFKAPATINFIEKNNVKVIREMGEVDMGDYRVLVQFVRDMVQQYPAKHYALVIWNHGSGWKFQEDMPRGISYDDSSGNHITTNQLQTAVMEVKQQLGRKLDILAMDACLMQMMEVVYAVADSVDYVVASEEVEPMEGYPYDRILARFAGKTTPANFCQLIVRHYGNFYSTYEPPDDDFIVRENKAKRIYDTSQSALDCSFVPRIKSGLDKICSHLIKGNHVASFKEALMKAQHFSSSGNIDLIDFLSFLKECSSDEELKKLITETLEVLDRAVIANSATAADGYSENPEFRANGIAVFLPGYSWLLKDVYFDLSWSKESLWDEMLLDYLKKIESQNISSALENGNIEPFKEFLKKNSQNRAEITSHVISKVNFLTFCETKLSDSLKQEISELINQN
ncbi:MAG: hypothetical protein HQM10_24035 [Candidatus Riflebacteria bacterium]|nr:hypothetical protein [Candidatus Riflebacteria bacterium]